ncbi:MAG: hypothetical protein IJS63_02390 [Bacteroidaceae bacterium]|nr:hypothetical protein [Bacteroidaceae bacterium]
MIQIRNIFRLNWFATCRLNYLAGGWKAVFRMPIKVYGRLKLSLRGRIELPENYIRNTLIIGEPYEDNTVSAGVAQLVLDGEWRIEGIVRIGIDCFIGIRKGGVLTIGDNVFIGRESQIRVDMSVIIQRDTIIAKSYLTDTNEHKILRDGNPIPVCRPVVIGQRGRLNPCIVLPGTILPPDTTVGIGSLCNRDYSSDGACRLFLAGNPARVKSTDTYYVT